MTAAADATPPTVADLAPDAILALDAGRTIVAANPAAAGLTGYSIERLVGGDCQELLDPRTPDGRRCFEDGWHRSTALPTVRSMPEQEVHLRRSDTTTVRVLATGSYQRGGDGKLTGVTLVLREAGRRSHKATSGIEIVSTVSHELRSPLTSVKGYTNLLLSRWDRIPDEQKREMLEQVQHDADRVHRLITELLDISRLETDRLVLKRQMVDLVALTELVLDKVRFSYPDLEVTTSFVDGYPQVYADPDKMEQVLTNLVENACKYGSAKGMRITGHVENDVVSLSVADRGEGIPEEDLPKVFTKFFRRELGRPTGSGLGLWISRGLVEAHGGELRAASAAGEGTTFTFTLPRFAFEELHGS